MSRTVDGPPGPDALPRHAVGPEDYDADGRFLYPGEVEDAMPEGHLSLLLTIYLVQTLTRLVADPARDSVHGNMPIYYRRGEPQRHVSPDAFFLRGLPMDDERRSYCLWKTGVVPRVAFEVVSRGYERKDEVANRALYEELGIPEYYWFAPDRRRLTALRLDPARGRYAPVAPEAAGRVLSPALGLAVGVEAGRLALYQDGRYVEPTPELVARLEAALAEKEAALAEKESALAAKDSELAALRRRLAELEGPGDADPGGA